MLRDFLSELCDRVDADRSPLTLGNIEGELGGLAISDPPNQAEVHALRGR